MVRASGPVNYPQPSPAAGSDGLVSSPAPANDEELGVLAPPDSDTAGSNGGALSPGHWTRVCRIDEIPQLGARVMRRAAEPSIAIFRTAADRVFALVDRCPHRGGPLSQGIVFGDRVACPLHNTCVDLDSGCAVAPDKGNVQSYPVKVDADVVYIDLQAPANAAL